MAGLIMAGRFGGLSSPIQLATLNQGIEDGKNAEKIL